MTDLQAVEQALERVIAQPKVIKLGWCCLEELPEGVITPGDVIIVVDNDKCEIENC